MRAIVLLIVVLAACAAPGPSRPAGAPPTAPPYIEGKVTSVDADASRVQVKAADGSNEAVITVTQQTRIVEEFGGGYEPSAVTQIAAGQSVAVWVGGPVRESFPVQADADVIVVRER